MSETPESVKAALRTACEAFGGDDAPDPLGCKSWVGLREHIRELEAACRVMAKAIKDVCSEVDWPELTNTMRQGLGCGVEDRGIHDRYEAAEYGYEDALERCAEFIKNAIADAEKDPLAAKFIEEARNG